MKPKGLILPALLFLNASVLPAQTLTVDAGKVEAQISPLIYGAGAEDVNHEIYGGLYDQRIFGEGFEEPAVMGFKDFTAYDAQWSKSNDMIQIMTSGFGKIIYQAQNVSKATVEVEMRIESAAAIAGLLLCVSNAADGADAFNGYEVSLNAEKGSFVFGKHEHNWQPIEDTPVAFNGKGEWNKLRVEQDGAHLTCYVNDAKVFENDDTNNPLTSGMVGLRSYGGSASYRNLTIDGVPVAFEPKPVQIAGFKQYDSSWSIEGELMRVITNTHGKAVYQGWENRQGEIEVEVRLDAIGAIAGFIFDVAEAGGGPDNFLGYEASLNASSHHFVFGKHEHNWQSIIDKEADVLTEGEWNKLRVVFDGTHADIYLNDNLIHSYIDNSSTPLLQGKVGLRSYGGTASYRNLKINGQTVELAYEPTGVSRMWEAVGNGTYAHDSQTSFTGESSQMISGAEGDGICNRGLNKWGIAVNEGETLHNVVYLKGTATSAWVCLQNYDGTKEYARTKIEGITTDWNRFAVDLTPAESDSLARYTLLLGESGDIWADQVMLYTDNYPFRKDITEAFKQERLTFLRYGGTMINAAEYLTCNMTGNPETREPYKGHWYLHSTNGFAIPEFVQFARLIGTEPAFAINIEDNPEDVLKMLREIEAYDVKFIEIGNEENIWTTERSAYEHYVERFLLLYDAIHAVYPDMQFINAAWWRPDQQETMEYVFHATDGKAAYWDYHPWTEITQQALTAETEIKQMKQLFLQWNPDTEMKCAVFEENGNTHDMARALAHATMLNVVRRSNGFVPLDSPANALQPDQQNDNGWDQGQIFFSPASTWMQPPYYAQQMAAENHHSQMVAISSSVRGSDITATRNEDGTEIVVHVVNYLTSKRNINLVLQNFGEVESITYSSLSGPKDGVNTMLCPRRYVPVEGTITPGDPLPVEPYSYTVFVIKSGTSSAIAQVLPPDYGTTTVYDLAGRRANPEDLGIHIVNNKKILKK